ncbi:MICAL-like protein 2a isoform X2 [Brachyhypopomus gauderio]|uniref:MICAL-like protein 2a isoform X2 n=1 Tax=Brachyhypopomus gauderio TaxID=698409 RepID=UPI00404338C8
MAAIKALQQWCKIQCDGYRNVAIVNMTTSFRDGLAFCALIHKFRPDLINFESLRKDNVYDNNHLAFCVAEDHLGIPALLDAEDMVALPVPDRLSILTYVSQYYNYFNSRCPTGGGGGIKRPAEGSKEEPSEKKNLPVVAKTHSPKAENRPLTFTASKSVRENCPPSLRLQKGSEKHAPAAEKRPPAARTHKHSCSPSRSSPSQVKASPHGPADEKTILGESSNKTGTLNSKCVVCGSHVHLVQRHLVDGKLYHRSCFKCCERPVPVECRVSGQEQDSVLSSSHSRAHSGPVKPEAARLPGSGPSPPGYASVLCSPVRALPRPLDPGPTQQPWMDSAQRTQEARRKFFLSADPVLRSSVGGSDKPLPAERASAREADPEKQRAPSTSPQNQAEGNSNNNNKAYSCGPTSRITPGSHCSPSGRQERPALTTVGGASQFNPSPSAPSPRSEESLPTGEDMGGGLLAVRRLQQREAPHTPAAQLTEGNCVTPENKIINSSNDHVTHQAPPTAPAVQSSGYRPRDPRESLSHQPDASLSLDESHRSREPSADHTRSVSAGSEIGDTFKTSQASERLCHIPVEEITKELQEIETSLSGLEKEGIELERKLRCCEEEGSGDVLMDPLMVDWFRLIQKKQSYIRRESELVYIARSQDLEQLQPGVEGQLRRLMNKPEHLKSAAEKKTETDLMTRLVEIVNDRNAIVDGLEQDRLSYTPAAFDEILGLSSAVCCS